MKVDKLYVITYAGKDEQEPLFWNDTTGYGSILTAEVYLSKQYNLPIDGAWQELWRAILRTVDFCVAEAENE